MGPWGMAGRAQCLHLPLCVSESWECSCVELVRGREQPLGGLVEPTQPPLTLLCSRLIMSTHRDLEALKRLGYRKAKARLAGKAPAPYTSKGAGNLPPGERSWRDL